MYLKKSDTSKGMLDDPLLPDDIRKDIPALSAAFEAGSGAWAKIEQAHTAYTARVRAAMDQSAAQNNGSAATKPDEEERKLFFQFLQALDPEGGDKRKEVEAMLEAEASRRSKQMRV